MTDDGSGNGNGNGNEHNPYTTLAGEGTSQFTVRGSEFLGHVRPVDSVAAAETFIENRRGAYDDATHTVPAYRVRAGSTGDLLREYESDDGEPSGSAGKPALNVLQGQAIENGVAVVTRYYGGTNLGVGGLVRAYSRAVSEAVTAAGVTTVLPHERLQLTVGYDDSGTVRGILESEDLEFEARYEAEVRFDVRVPLPVGPALRERLRSATSGRIEIDE